MSIIINGTTLGSDAYIGSTKLNKIIFNNTTVWEGFPSWNNNGLEYNSWETIQAYIKAGRIAEKISVGATKTFLLNGKTYTAEVVSINNGTGSASMWYPANTVDFISKELYETASEYTSTGQNASGFPLSSVATTLQDTIYPTLPTGLKNVIITKSHMYQMGYYDAVNRSWVSQMYSYGKKLWLPTYYEMAGTAKNASDGETSTNNKQYTLATKIKKPKGGTSAMTWWLSTPNCNSGTSILCVNSEGTVGTSGRVSVKYLYPICFRIG